MEDKKDVGSLKAMFEQKANANKAPLKPAIGKL